MKTFFNFFIIIFVVASLYLVRDDLKSIYSKALSYLENNSELKSLLQVPAFQNVQDISQETELSGGTNLLKKVIATPGPLRVADQFLSTSGENVDLSVAEVIKETNKSRKEINDLSSLEENQKLDLSAQRKLNDMFTNQYFEHISPSGVKLDDLVNLEKYEYILVGENLAMGNFKNNRSLLDGWMASPGHRANILNGNYAEIGVAVGQGMFEGKKVWLAVQHFGLPRDACPAIDGILKGMIELDQKNIGSLEQNLIERRRQIASGAIIEGDTTNEQINIYNELVKEFNDLNLNLKDKISTYNLQVKSFNNCIEFFNKGLAPAGE